LNEEFQNKLEEENKAMQEEEEEESDIHGRLSDEENFAELPAVEVMNKVNDDEKSKRS